MEVARLGGASCSSELAGHRGQAGTGCPPRPALGRPRKAGVRGVRAAGCARLAALHSAS